MLSKIIFIPIFVGNTLAIQYCAEGLLQCGPDISSSGPPGQSSTTNEKGSQPPILYEFDEDGKHYKTAVNTGTCSRGVNAESIVGPYPYTNGTKALNVKYGEINRDIVSHGRDKSRTEREHLYYLHALSAVTTPLNEAYKQLDALICKPDNNAVGEAMHNELRRLLATDGFWTAQLAAATVIVPGLAFGVTYGVNAAFNVSQALPGAVGAAAAGFFVTLGVAYVNHLQRENRLTDVENQAVQLAAATGGNTLSFGARILLAITTVVGGGVRYEGDPNPFGKRDGEMQCIKGEDLPGLVEALVQGQIKAETLTGPGSEEAKKIVSLFDPGALQNC